MVTTSANGLRLPGGARAFAFLGVEPSERRTAALMAAHSFFMGVATVFFETAASATFLSRFSASYLPWIYIAAAGVNTLTGTVYARVQRHVSFARLMKGTLWFLLSLVLSVRTGLALSGVAWIAFAGLVSYRILSSLTDLEFWAVASRIYDVRQAKRLFGLIGTGEVIARIAGAFSVPLLVSIGGVSNLMLLSAGALALSLLLLGAVLGSVTGVHDRPRAAATREARAGLREIAASPYLALVIGVAVLATFGKYFVDFAFLEQMSTATRGEAQLATFLGIFNGLAQTLSLLTRLFVSRPFLARFGIRVGVVVLPVMHALCAAVIVACGLLGASPAVVFWLVVANQGIYKAFKHPIDNASFKVLYQPLVAAQRLAAQIAVEVVFAPIVVGLAGVVMLLFSAGMDYDPVKFAAVLLGNFVAWAVLARAAGLGYAKRLVDNLRSRLDGTGRLPLADAATLDILRTRLTSSAPQEVCIALSLLEKAGARDLTDALISRVTHDSPEVRAYALERLVELHPAVLRGLRVLQVTADTVDALDEIAPYLQDPDPVLRRAAVAALFHMRHDAMATRAATAAIAGYATSALAADRILAARLAGEHALAAVVRGLLGDPLLDVKRAALHAAGRCTAGDFTGELVAALADPRLARTAATALAMRGDAALAVLAPWFRADADRQVLRRVVEVHQLAGGPAAIAALRAQLAFPDAAVRGWILAALDALGYVAEGSERAAIAALVHDEVREAAWTLGALRDLAAHPELHAALEADVVAARERVFALLTFAHDRTAVRRVAAHLAHGTKEKRAYAHEVLDLMLDPGERELVMPLLDDLSSVERLRRLGGHFPQPALGGAARLHALAIRNARWQPSFSRALALRAAMPPSSPVEERSAMLLIEKVIMLKMVPMFARTSEELLAEIAAIIEEVDVRAGATVFEKGDVGESMYVVVAGRVRVLDGDAELAVLAEKEVFGELALLDPQPRSASVKAIGDVRLFRLDGETFSQLMANNPEIVRGVLHVVCERLRRTSTTAGIV